MSDGHSAPEHDAGIGEQQVQELELLQRAFRRFRSREGEPLLLNEGDDFSRFKNFAPKAGRIRSSVSVPLHVEGRDDSRWHLVTVPTGSGPTLDA